MTAQQIDQVRQLSLWLAGTDITLFELSGPGTTIRLRRNGDAAAQFSSPVVTTGQGQATAPASTVVRAGSVGLLLHSHPLREEPLVRMGDEVVAGQAVALLRIGLVLLAVPAPRPGKVARIVAAHESVVGFGDALIEIE
jgi:acetyl-CoA carboxylase biotin carboxyl carrier protein